MNVILCEPHEVDADGLVTLTDVHAMHVREVLKAAAGEQLRVGIVDGPLGQAEVVSIEDGRVELRCGFDRLAAAPERPPVDLLLALPRPKVMRRLWAQLAAIGVGRIILTNAARVERHYFDTHILQEATYRPLLIEGLQQARDTRLPRVSVHRQFRKLVEDDLAGFCEIDGVNTRLVAHPGAHPGAALASASPAGLRRRPRALLAIGPEGGWNDFELDLLQRHGFELMAMGPRVLRTDTACIALLALLHAALT